MNENLNDAPKGQATPMTKSELALSLIRAPWSKRLTDRSFILAVAAGLIGLYLFQQKAIDGNTLVGILATTWGPWIVGNQATTALVGSAAVKDTPDTIAAAGDVSFQGAAPVGAQPPAMLANDALPSYTPEPYKSLEDDTVMLNADGGDTDEHNAG